VSLDELTTLLHGAAEYAVDQLCSQARLAPFAVTLDKDGNIKYVTEDSDQFSIDDEVLSSIRPDLQQGADEGILKAIAVVTNRQILHPKNGQPVQAIRVDCEHSAHSPITGFVPYTLSGNKINLDDLFFEDGEYVFFQDDLDS